MATRSTQEQDRAAATDTAVRGLLHAGNTPAARWKARSELERALKTLHQTDPAAAALADAHIAGWLAAIAAALPDRQFRKPRGYQGGPPSAAHLIAAYEYAYAETTRTQ